MQPLYIFDLDGTLALITHRLKYINCPRESRDWERFYAECVNDLPNVPVIKTMVSLIESNCCVWIFSGRSDAVRDQTVAWIARFVPWFDRLILKMRPAGDYTPDYALKRRWFQDMSQADKQRLVAVFEDRKRVVDMWRDEGVTCFQVADGEF